MTEMQLHWWLAIAAHALQCDQYLTVRACLIRCLLSAESFSGNWMSKVMMRFPLWEGSWDSGIPSPVTTFLYAGLHTQENGNRCRWNPKHIPLQLSLLKCTVCIKCLNVLCSCCDHNVHIIHLVFRVSKIYVKLIELHNTALYMNVI